MCTRTLWVSVCDVVGESRFDVKWLESRGWGDCSLSVLMGIAFGEDLPNSQQSLAEVCDAEIGRTFLR